MKSILTSIMCLSFLITIGQNRYYTPSSGKYIPQSSSNSTTMDEYKILQNQLNQRQALADKNREKVNSLLIYILDFKTNNDEEQVNKELDVCYSKLKVYLDNDLSLLTGLISKTEIDIHEIVYRYNQRKKSIK